mmetsp:Transcript_40042/g.74642  ORF Transcript_40042/g.74642 Transcript_40042/m.74642 type:complete len:100 (+) Transcript_40042:1063-1362(+)
MRQRSAARCMRGNCGTPRRSVTEVEVDSEAAEMRREEAVTTGIGTADETVTEIEIGIVTDGIGIATRTENVSANDEVLLDLSNGSGRLHERSRPCEKLG